MTRELADCVIFCDSKRIPVSSADRRKMNKIYPYYGAQGIVDYVDDYIFDGEYLLVAEDGNNLKSLNEKIVTWASGKIWVNNHAHILKEKEGFDLKFIYYALGVLDIRNIITGSAQPKLTKDNLAKLKLTMPATEEQKRISNLLSTIDDKILANSRTIETFEKLMREIYDYWFVQFDFPNENGRPYKSSGGEMVYDEKLKREIPKGWKAIELGDIIKEAKKSSVQVNGAREKVGSYPFFTSGDEILDFDEYYVDGFNIFLNTGGNADIKSYYGKSAYSTDTWCISADKYSYMLFIFLDSIKEQINNNCFAGSGLKHLQKNAFKKIKIVAPEDNLLRTFNDLAQSSYQAISSYKTENKKLASLRDWLLPMLMNGQVKIAGDS